MTMNVYEIFRGEVEVRVLRSQLHRQLDTWASLDVTSMTLDLIGTYIPHKL